MITSQYSRFPTLRNVADLQAKLTENEQGFISEIIYFLSVSLKKADYVAAPYRNVMYVPAPTTVRRRRCRSPAVWAERWGFHGWTRPWRRRPSPPGRPGRTPGSRTGNRCTRL